MREIFLAAVLLLMMGCGSAPERSTTALKKAGYSKIEITGWEPFECGQDDTYSTGFVADNPVGTRVSGVVCCGLWKNCTIRF